MTTVGDYLRARGIQTEEIPHELTHSALGEAARLGVPAKEVAKTIVLDTHGGRALAVIPASERLDMGLVHRAVGDSHARLASEEELQRDYPDFELGAFPPLGSLLDVPLYVDPKVMEGETVVFAAGTADTSLRVTTRDLFREQDPVVAPLVKEPHDGDKEPFSP
jgi:Ala-tRNA(Pro) deacylase